MELVPEYLSYMPIPFAINTGSTISGTTQVGNIAVGTTEQRYDLGYGGLDWFMGPDDNDGYIVGYEGGGTIQFRGSNGYSDEAYVTLANSVSLERGGTGITSSAEANIWFGENGIYLRTGYTAKYEVLYNSWTNKPNWVVSSALNALMSKLEGSNNLNVNYLSRFDAAWLFGIHTNDGGEAVKNIVNPGTNDATLVNSPYFNEFSGFKTDGVSSYVNLNWNATDDGSNSTLSSASFGVYGLDQVTPKIGGHGTAVNPRTGIFRNYNGTNSYIFINQDINSTMTPSPVDDFKGLFAVTRSGSTQPHGFSMGTMWEGLARAETGIGSATDLRIGQNGGNDTDERIGFTFVGGHFNTAEFQELETILDWWFNFEWLSLGNELLDEPNFDAQGNWNLSSPTTIQITGGTCVFTETPSYAYINQSNLVTEGKYYLVEIDCNEVTAGNYLFRLGTIYPFPFYITWTGKYKYIYRCQSSGEFRIYVGGPNSPLTATFNSCSLKEIIGLTS